MITYGYAINHHYTGDGVLMIQCRVPTIHGAYSKRDYNGKPIKSYTEDSALPWYPSLILPHLPSKGDVVALSSLDNTMNNLIVIGLTGGNYRTNQINKE